MKTLKMQLDVSSLSQTISYNNNQVITVTKDTPLAVYNSRKQPSQSQ
jgi:hypothetical protein